MTVTICTCFPRFAFVVAAGGPRAALARGPAALAPAPGEAQVIGEISPGAEALGLYPGMRLGEALARCPELALLPADPLAVATAWGQVLARLESIGAAVESGPPGVAWLEAAPLARLHAGAAPAAVRGAGATVPAWLPSVVGAVRAGLRGPGARAGDGIPAAARIGAGPTRFCAQVGALRAGSRAAEYVDGAAALHDEPVTLLRTRPELAPIVPSLERLGLSTLGALVRVGRPLLADRFGAAGVRAHELAAGRDLPLTPRVPGETLEEVLELPESAAGDQLRHATGLLVDRLLARSERRGRSLRSVVLGARLVEGGTWRTRVVFRAPLADPERMRLVLDQQVLQIPAPAHALLLAADRFGPPHAAADELLPDDRRVRRDRLREAVAQARAAGGPDAALRVLAIDAGSRVPERRLVLTPREP